MDDLLGMEFPQAVPSSNTPFDPFASDLSGVMDVLNTMGSSNAMDVHLMW